MKKQCLLVFRSLLQLPIIFLVSVAIGTYVFFVISILYCSQQVVSAEVVENVGESENQEEYAYSLFDPVDRSPKRLRDSAFAFASSVGMRAQVEPLYKEKELEYFGEYIRRARILQRKKRMRTVSSLKRKTAVGISSHRSITKKTKDTWDPRFSLPIPRGSFWLSSPFGPRKKANGKWGFHHGIDMAANRGTPIYAAGGGQVIEAGYARGYGNTVMIEHDGRFRTRYAHMQSIAVRQGDVVAEGAVIGTVGATGYVRKSGGDGSHLHFEVRDHGRSCNPFYFLK